MRRGGTATESTAKEREQRLGRYRLLDLIGRDGDARQYRALDANGRAVELWTVPLARLCADAAGLERFRQMATAAARLSHPAIPAILASGEHAGTAFVATTPAEGPTLAAQLDGGPVPWNEAVATLDRVLDALSAAHRAGVVHGALTTDVIRHSGSAAVIGGFGRAALTAANADRKGDLEAAARLTERILAGHEDRPAVAALLADLRGGGAFPDVASLHLAASGLIGVSRPGAAMSAGPRRWPIWVGGVVLAGGLAAAAVLLINPPSPPRTVSEEPTAESAATAPPTPSPAAAPSAPPSAPPSPPPSPPAASRQPPVAEIAQALRAIPCALVTVERNGGRLLVSGTVAGERAETEVRETVEALAAGWDHGFDLAGADARFCAPLGSVATALDANRGLTEPLAASVLEGPDLNAGDPLVLEIRAPARPVQLQVDYFTIDGSVVHLLPNPSDSGSALAAGASRRLGEKAGDGKPQSGRYWTIGPPFGTEMLLTIATAAPLFPTPRPEQEPAADYLAALSDALATLPDDAPAPLADARFIATGP